MNCIWTVWYKRKRKDYQGRVLLLFVGSIIQSGENVKLPPGYPLFSSYTINNSRRFNFGAVVFWFLVVFAHTPPLHRLTCVVLGCRFQDGKHYCQWFVYSLSDYTVSVHTRISAHDADYYCKSYCNIFGWDTVERIRFRSIRISFPLQAVLIYLDTNS